MSFDIDKFKSRIGGALASPANFRVLFTGAIVNSDSMELLSMLCNKTQFPGRMFATNEYTTHGPIIKMPYQSIYDDIVLSFYCKEDMGVSKLFQDWQTFIQDNSSTNEFSYFEDYVSDVIVEQYDNQGNTIHSIKLIDAYPIMVAPMQLDWATQNGFHELSITMAYRYWREEPINLNPFGNFLQVNNLYPNFDVSGALERTGVALFSRTEGQFMSSVAQTISFSRNVNRQQGSLSSQQQQDTTSKQ